MGRVVFYIVIPVLLAACGGPSRTLPDGLKSQKAACAGGNYSVCSEIGHQVREAQGGPVTPTTPFVLSQPIID